MPPSILSLVRPGRQLGFEGVDSEASCLPLRRSITGAVEVYDVLILTSGLQCNPRTQVWNRLRLGGLIERWYKENREECSFEQCTVSTEKRTFSQVR